MNILHDSFCVMPGVFPRLLADTLVFSHLDSVKVFLLACILNASQS